MKIEKWLRPTIIGLVFSLPVILPFLVTGSLLFPYITGKNYFFRIVTELALGGWLILALSYPKYRLRISPLVYAFSAFVLCIGLADAFGVNPMKSFWSNNERMEGFITVLHLAALFGVVAHIFTEKLWSRLVQTSLGISAMVAIQGFVELGQGVGRIDGSFGNSTYLGVYALVHVFFALLMILKEVYSTSEGRTLRHEHLWIFSGLLVLNTITLYFTGTRGALLGLVTGLLLTSIIYAVRERNHPTLRKVAFGIIGLVVAGVVTLASLRGTEFVDDKPLLKRFSSLATLNIKEFASTEGAARINIWNVAWEGVKERPVLGWGQENFTYVFSKHYNPNLFNQEQWFDRTHNVFFDWLIAGGVLGLLSYLSLFGAMLWMLWRNYHKTFSTIEQGVLTGLIAAYFVHNFFVFDNLVSYVFIIFVLSYVHIKSFPIPDMRVQAGERSVATSITIGLIIVALAIPFALNAQNILSSKSLINGLVNVRTASSPGIDEVRAHQFINESLNDFRKSFNHSIFNDVEILEQLSNEVNQVVGGKFEEETKNGFVNLVKEKYTEALTKNPDARDFLLYGSFLGRVGDLSGAEVNIKKAVEMSPTKQTMRFALAQVYSAQKKDKEALEEYRIAYELDKSFAEPKLWYALALSKNGNKVEASKLLSEIPESMLLNRKYVNTYIALGRYDLVAKVFEQMVKDDPKNVQLRVSLAAAYLESNQRPKSIEVLESIIASNPEYAVQIKGLISEIRAGRNPIDK